MFAVKPRAITADTPRMPPDLTGVPGIGRTPLLPASGARVSGPVRALPPVGPVGPRPAPAADTLLGRSGVGLGELLLTADLLDQREAVAPVALEMGLEEARASLLRLQPGDALAALDAIWAKAQRSEEGWYLRAGALTVMGLPGEGDRVAAEGLQVRPESAALRFVQSVARVLLGDLVGAREAIAPALDAAPRAPVLMAQQAVLLARQGKAGEGAALVDRLLAEAPDHPAVGWVRATLRSVAADRTRQAARRGPAASFGPGDNSASTFTGRLAPTGRADENGATDGTISAAEAADGGAIPPALDAGDVAVTAFARLGTRLPTATDQELAREARTLLRAFSSGGTMGAAVTPEQAHAARTVLSGLFTLLSPAAKSEPEVAAPPVVGLLASVLSRRHTGRRPSEVVPSDDEVARLLRRASGAVPSAQRRLVEVLFEASRHGARPTPGVGSPDAPEPYRPVVQGESEPGSPVVPIRLGLALLAESRDTRAADAALWTTGEARAITPWRDRTPASPGLTALPDDGRERLRSGWTVARLVADQQPVAPASGRHVGVAAILCVSAALAAAINGATVIAVALGIGAAWLGVRRGARPRGD